MPDFLIDLSHPSGVPTVVEGLGLANAVTETNAIRGTSPAYRVRFMRDGVIFRPPGISLSFIVKSDLKFDGDTLVSATGGEWTIPATDAEYYTASPNFGTTGLNALLFSPDANPTNDIEKITCMGAFSWRVGAGSPTECARFAVIVSNKVITGDETAPIVAGPSLDTRLTTIEVAIALASGRLKINAASIVSGPAEWLDGAIFSGGSGTTTLPHLLVQPSTATAATTWSTAGTVFGINTASGFAGKFVDFRVNGGASVFSISYFGGLTAGQANFTGAVVATGPVTVGTYTVSTLPSASGSAGATVLVSNESGGAVLAFCDGTNWRRVTDRAIVS